MNKIFSHFDRVFMEVVPCKSLFRSTMVHDVITKGRKFVVDMNTGELTIWNPSSGQVEASFAPIKPATSSTKPAVSSAKPASPFAYQRTSGVKRYLSQCYETAVNQLEEEFKDGHTKGRLIFCYDDGKTKTLCISTGNTANFLNRVKAQYSLLKDPK